MADVILSRYNDKCITVRFVAVDDDDGPVSGSPNEFIEFFGPKKVTESRELAYLS
jgi:hypothetical protein